VLVCLQAALLVQLSVSVGSCQSDATCEWMAAVLESDSCKQRYSKCMMTFDLYTALLSVVNVL